MSTSASGGEGCGAESGGAGAEKFRARVRPGGLEGRRRRDCRGRALMRLDCPTFERPAKATSGGPSGGSARIFGASVTKRQGRRNRGIASPAGVDIIGSPEKVGMRAGAVEPNLLRVGLIDQQPVR